MFKTQLWESKTLRIFKFQRYSIQGSKVTVQTIMIFSKTMCIKQGFWPPLMPEIESYFTAFSLGCFIKRLTQVFLFYINLTLTVTMVTENGHQYRLK